jgi:hypothetical protein
MKKYFFILSFLLVFPILLSGQTTDLASKCAMNTGPFLKDYVVKLGKGATQPELRYKDFISLSKNITYKFTLCNAENSAGQLIMKIKDNATGKIIFSTYDEKSGRIIPSFNFPCTKTGKYDLLFDFRDFQQGSGVGVVSLVTGKK